MQTLLAALTELPLALLGGRRPGGTGGLLEATLGALRGSAETMAAVVPDATGRAAWREMGDKVQAYERFRAAASLLPPGGGAAALQEGVARARAGPPFARPWLLEGVGFAWAGAAAGGTAGLLSAARTGPLPAAAVLPLHTGAGLALASRAVAAAVPPVTASVLADFLASCEAATCPGLAGALVEALGVAARTLRPERVHALGSALAATAPARVPLFWHGVGRGLYFAPSRLLPWGGPAGRALDAAAAEPPASARLDALAGFSWALTLVNLEQPEVLAAFLERRLARDGGVPDEEAFAHGTAMALLTWAQEDEAGPVLGGFLGHRPAGATAAAWDRLVTRPAALALAQVGPLLRRTGRWEEMFRFRPLAELAARLRGLEGEGT